MSAVTRDLDPVTGVFTALAAVRFVICYEAHACRVCAFFRSNVTHDDLSVAVETECRRRAECQWADHDVSGWLLNVVRRLPRTTICGQMAIYGQGGKLLSD